MVEIPISLKNMHDVQTLGIISLRKLPQNRISLGILKGTQTAALGVV